MRMVQLLAPATAALLTLSVAQAADKNAAKLSVTSSAFQQGQSIPAKYTCDGENISPPLKWTDAPTATKSFALISDDPDAPMGTWVHWVVYSIPAATTELAEKT